MEITKAYLEARLAEWRAGQQQAQADYNMYGGAIHAAEDMLAELDRQEPEKVNDGADQSVQAGGDPLQHERE